MHINCRSIHVYNYKYYAKEYYDIWNTGVDYDIYAGIGDAWVCVHLEDCRMHHIEAQSPEFLEIQDPGESSCSTVLMLFCSICFRHQINRHVASASDVRTPSRCLPRCERA